MRAALLVLGISLGTAAAYAQAPPSAPCGAQAEAEARACMMRGDNACVIRLLTSCTPTRAAILMLIEAHRALDHRDEARRLMHLVVPMRERRVHDRRGDYWHRTPPPWQRERR
jgi:hypothetical protein